MLCVFGSITFCTFTQFSKGLNVYEIGVYSNYKGGFFSPKTKFGYGFNLKFTSPKNL